MLNKQAIWDTENYYHQAREASLDFSHPGLKKIKALAKQMAKILEVGCGEGTKLAQISQGKKTAWGVDITQAAIERARRQYPNLQFKVADAANLPYENNHFDLVYSVFSLEHFTRPQEVVSEMIRVTKRGGFTIWLAPNYGAPNRVSPCFSGSRMTKLVNGFFRDLFWLVCPPKELNWLRVKPRATKTNYEIDWDVTVEPYLNSLKWTVLSLEEVIKEISSFWLEIPESRNLGQKLFAFLGKYQIYPFTYWGPHLLIVAKKIEI